eukprot:TRINITY_DN11658_c0_g1_i1.p1 TRINITY_DN11658_c0_g1~~TRINITY_DN11658_c0_g1_i1.p1  ORF type:complete len:499 (+),score=111.51 TRINITY_DN11658_c0_g1_i1:68-1564(+)
MSSKPRSASVKVNRPEGNEDDKETTGATAKKGEKFEPPPRPPNLGKELKTLYMALGVAIAIFAAIGQLMYSPIPEGKFQMKDGSFIEMKDYDPVKLGPFPKCHPHFEEYEVKHEKNKTSQWVKISAAPKEGPFPPGHPENPEYLKWSHEEAVQDNIDNRFRWVGLQPSLHLLVMASMVVYIGCKHGVYLFTAPPGEGVEAEKMVSSSDAYWFPIMGSCALFGLFLVLKYLGNDIVKVLITCVVVFMCALGVGANVDHVVCIVKNQASKPLFKVPVLDETVTLPELLGMLAGFAAAGYYVPTKNWIINNLFGISFSIMGIKMIPLSSFKAGAIMLIGLFFYDVFWVFYSKGIFGANVMVSVAKGIEAPIKLLFPRKMGGCGTLIHSMLGLGDIVVPGIFLAFLAKWDAIKMGEKKSKSFIYLDVTMVAYVLSLVTTVGIMLIFNHAQPALLYIVPFVLIASSGVAVSRGEFKEILNYEIPEEQPDKKKEEKEAESKKDS